MLEAGKAILQQEQDPDPNGNEEAGVEGSEDRIHEPLEEACHAHDIHHGVDHNECLSFRAFPCEDCGEGHGEGHDGGLCEGHGGSLPHGDGDRCTSQHRSSMLRSRSDSR